MVGRKGFFFEKKNQKTFVRWRTRRRNAYAKLVKVFWFFFSKENLFLPSLAFALTATAWLFTHPGWPQNHEVLRGFRRIGIFAGQWRLGHLIPVWSTTAFGGAGSPSPILYHKAFTWLATALDLLTGNPRLSVCLAVVAVLAALFLGVARSCRILLGRADLLIEATAGMMAVFAIYTTNDWLIRGAMSETAAMAIAAWLFAWCLTLIRHGRFAWWIGPVMALMYFAHPVIAFYSAIPLGVALAAAVMQWRARSAAWLLPALVSIGICAAMTAPWLLASLPMARFASLSLLVDFHMMPRHTHRAVGRLFFERSWHWQNSRTGVLIQIDWLMLALGALAVPACAVRRDRWAAGAFLAAVCAIMFVLQTAWALPFYDVVPGAAWIQFSFRLEVFLIIALAVSAALALDAVRDRAGAWPLGALCAVAVVAMSLGKPWLGRTPPDLYSAAEIDAALSSEAQAPEPWEYAPSPPWPAIYVYRLRPSGAAGCFATPLDDMTRERATARFAVGCTLEGSARLPVALAPGMSFSVAGRRVAAFRVCPEALARLTVPVQSVITVTFPTFWSVIGTALRGRDPALACR